MVTIKTLSKRTGYNQSTINRWIHEGLLPAKKINTGKGPVGFKYVVSLKTYEEFKQTHKVGAPRPRASYIRDKNTYAHLIKHENKFKEDASVEKVVVEPTQEKEVKTIIKRAVESTERANCIKYLEDFLARVYPTHELTPQEYVFMKKTIKILKGEN